MKKIFEWLKENIILVFAIVLTLMLFKTCSTSNNVNRLTKEIKQMEIKVDSLQSTQITATDLKIEGLKSEKRMIQSTDRKKFDLERENQIDKELQELMKK